MITLSYNELSSRLKVTAPLLMLDMLSVDVESGTAVGVKRVSIDEAHFAGHFPGEPVVPGVLQVAGMCQSASILFIESAKCGAGEMPVPVALKRVKFRTPVRPGMTLTVSCERTAENEDGSVDYTVKNTVEGQLASSGTVTIAAKGAEWYAVAGGAGVSPLLASAGDSFLDAQGIMAVIPHRYPFLFVDRVYGLDNITEVIGYKNITGNGMFTGASYPAQFAGYLQIEAGAQLGCAAILSQPSERGKLGFFMSIDTAVFHSPVLAGEQLSMKVNCELKGRFGIATGVMYAGERLATETSIKFAILSAEEAKA